MVWNGQRLCGFLGKRVEASQVLAGSITDQHRVRIALIGSFLTLVGMYTLVERPFVLNLSPSIPLGLYARGHGELDAGTLIEFRCSVSPARKNRFFGQFILKPILAGPNDHVDTIGEWLRVNGRRIAPIHTTDSNGNSIPVWRASRLLNQDEFFVFSARVPNSWDSRYFGPIRKKDILAVRVPLWTWGRITEHTREAENSRSSSNNHEGSFFVRAQGKTSKRGRQDKSRRICQSIRPCSNRSYGESSSRMRLSVFARPLIFKGVSETLMPRRPINEAEPDRIARPGLGGGQQNQPLHVDGTRHRSTARGPTTFARNPLRQRVIVKIGFSRHHSVQHGRESLSRRAVYLAREAVQRSIESGRFYDAKRDGVDVKSEILSWAEDRHVFPVIVSPENGQSLGDLTAYTREVMSRVERDLGPLQWFGVNHTNTDNPHVHLLIRGKNADGTDLVISRKYISRGIRDRASEVATEWLGERTREQAQSTLSRETRAERWTTLDGALSRLGRTTPDGLRIDFKNLRLSRYGLITLEHLSERLDFLKATGLARQLPGEKRAFLGRASMWAVAPDFPQRLNALEERQSIIKGLYASLGKDATALVPQVHRLHSSHNLAADGPRMGRGIVLAKGPMNELSDERFVVVEDRTGKVHYFRVWANKEYDAVRAGGVVEIGRSAFRQSRMAQEIRRVAEYAKDLLYSTARHREWIQSQNPRPASGEMERRLRSFALSISKLAGQATSGITRSGKGTFAVDFAKLNQFLAQHNRWPDVRVIAAYPLADQVHARAYTWLDRQIIRAQVGKKMGPYDLLLNPRVQAAIGQRTHWLVENGYARIAEKEGRKRVEFLPGAIGKLIASEHKQFVQRCYAKYRKCFIELKPGQVASGIYRGVAYEHRGEFALIETEKAIYAAPISRAPWVERGQRASAKGVAPGFARVEIDRPAASLKTLGLER